MDEALVGLAGIVIGAVLGGTTKYWALRRDAWRDARSSGLLLLADVRALCRAQPTSPLIGSLRLGVESWEAHSATLAAFRRGVFPNGFRAHDWLTLAAHFARLRELDAQRSGDLDPAVWKEARVELSAAEQLLRQFEDDPRLFLYVLAAPVRFFRRRGVDHRLR